MADRTEARHRTLLISQDVVGERMAGPGIRYWHLAQALAPHADVTLAVPDGSPPGAAARGAALARYARRQWASLRPLVESNDIVVCPSDIVSDFPELAASRAHLVVDGYDPLLAAGAALFVTGGVINEHAFGGNLIQGYYITWRVLIFGSAAVLIVAGLARLEPRGWTFPRRFSLWAGGASYALYLGHTLVLAATHEMGLDAWLSRYPGWAAQAAFVGLAVLMLAYSMAHYRWLERPLHRLFRGWLRA